VAGRLDMQVEREQGDGHRKDAVTERLCATLVHGVILPEEVSRSPEMIWVEIGAAMAAPMGSREAA
jgi:hypothetical protein